MSNKPEWYKAFLWLWTTYATVVSAICIRMIFNHNNGWRQLSHRNGILWGLAGYLILRAVFYIMYLTDNSHIFGEAVYFFLIDGPTAIFFTVYTQLVLYWAQMAGSSRLEEKHWKRGYYLMLVVISAVVIVNITYREQNYDDGRHSKTTRYVYGLTLGVLSEVLSGCFLYYGWHFSKYLYTLSEGDVRRRRLPRTLAAMVFFSVLFVVYGCFIIFCYAAGMPYLPGLNDGLTHSEESAVVFRTLDVFLASLIVYIVQRPGTGDWGSKTMTEPLLENDSNQFLTHASFRHQMGISVATEEYDENRAIEELAAPDRRGRVAAQAARQDRFAAMSQPMTSSQPSPPLNGVMSMSEDDDAPYRNRVMQHYHTNYASFSPTLTGNYEPPSAPGTAQDLDGLTTI